MDENQKITEEKEQTDPVLERMQQLFPDTSAGALADGLEAICKAHPETDTAELASDTLFARFAAGRGDTLDCAYEAYIAFAGVMNDEVRRRVEARTARASASANARTGGPEAGLTRTQREMLSEWNESYPEYAMTGREYMNLLKNK